MGMGSFVRFYKKSHSIHIGTLKEVNQVVLVYICRVSGSPLVCNLLTSGLFPGWKYILIGEVSIFGYNMSVVIMQV